MKPATTKTNTRAPSIARALRILSLKPAAPHPRSAELEFLPAALEIIETPPSPTMRLTAGALAAFFVIALIWAVFGHVDIIASASGKVVPLGRTKTIQPLDAGLVRAIHVRDGDRVEAGQLLVELDATLVGADRERTRHELARLRLDLARLIALRTGLDGKFDPQAFIPPSEALPADVARARATMLAQVGQQEAKLAALDQQIAQKTAEAESIAVAIARLEAGLPLISETAEIRRKVMEMQYGNRIAHLDAQLKLVDARHELATQRHRAAENVAARTSLEWQREQARAEYARAVMSELAEAQQKSAQLAEDLAKATRKVEDQTLRAPIAGTVQQLALHTIGGVVTPAQPLMMIVPLDAGVEIEAMVGNADIGFVEAGQRAEIKIATFNFTRYGLLRGVVTSVSRDAILRERPETAKTATAADQPGQDLTFAARISLDDPRINIDGRWVSLAPGMAVTAEIRTGTRRIIEYLLSPVLRAKHESLRER